MDKLDRLYAPWRSDYVAQNRIIDGCVFCYIAKHDDEDLGILYKTKDYFVVMNKYPYSPGHFMIIPNLHTDKLEELDIDIWHKMNTTAVQGVKMLKEVLNASGVNIGMNLGITGGAGIAEHIHLHLVPRWQGDTNFITTIANTRVFSTDFEKIYKKLKQNVDKYFK